MAIFIGLFGPWGRQGKAVAIQDAAYAGVVEEIGKSVGQRVVLCPFEDDETLLKRCVQFSRNQGVAAGGSEFRGDRQGQRNDADVGIAGLNELGSLGDIFAIDQPLFDATPDLGRFQRLTARMP